MVNDGEPLLMLWRLSGVLSLTDGDQNAFLTIRNEFSTSLNRCYSKRLLTEMAMSTQRRSLRPPPTPDEWRTLTSQFTCDSLSPRSFSLPSIFPQGITASPCFAFHSGSLVCNIQLFPFPFPLCLFPLPPSQLPHHPCSRLSLAPFKNQKPNTRRSV